MHTLTQPRRLRGTAAFTLVELMVVLLVVGVLVALGLAKFAPAMNAGKSTRAKAEVVNALKDASAYYSINRSYAGIEEDTTTNFSSVRDSVEASVGDCDPEEMETAASEGTVSICVDDQDLIATSCDHAGNAWTVVSGDGTVSGPTKAAGACDGISSTCYTGTSDIGGAGQISSVCVSGDTMTITGSGLTTGPPIDVIVIWDDTIEGGVGETYFGSVFAAGMLPGDYGCGETPDPTLDCHENRPFLKATATEYVIDISGIVSHDLTQADKIHFETAEEPVTGIMDIVLAP